MAHAARQPAIDRHIFGLDALRALAIMLVLVGHASFTFLPLTHRIDTWLVQAYYGVELFFVLSGYLICGILIRQIRARNFELRSFWKRRWLRTLPNYFLFLGLNFLLERYVQGAWPDAWAPLLFVQSLAWPPPPFFPESWSLSFEEIFYLIAPVMVLLFAAYRRVTARSVVALLTIGIGMFTLARIGYVWRYDPSWDAGTRKIVCIRLDAFLFGAIIVLLQEKLRSEAQLVYRLFYAGLSGIVVGFIIYCSVDRDHDFFSRTLLFTLVLASFAAILPLATRWRTSTLPAFATVAVRKIALWSYSLYLCQLLVLRVMTQVMHWNAASTLECTFEALAFIAVSIACAAFCYHIFERPILIFRDRVTRAETQPEAVA